MKNWKTTCGGILGAAGTFCPYFGVPAEVGAAIATLGIFLMGLFGKDSNVTGGTVKQ